MRWTRTEMRDIEPPKTIRQRPVWHTALQLAVFLLIHPAFTMAADPVELRLASDTWSPFTDGPEKQRVAVELVHTALERAGISATTTIVDWKDVEAGIKLKTFDGSAAMWHTGEREKDLVFSEPYLENRLVLVGRKGSDVAVAQMSDLAGKRVAAVSRYAYGDEVDKAVGVLFISARNDQDSLTKLLENEVEYMLVDELVARYLVAYQKEEVAAKLEIGTTPMARRTLHFAIRRDIPRALEIIESFNNEILGMLIDGTYSKTLQVGWIRVDVDGDGLDELVALGDRVGELPPGSVYDVFGTAPEVPQEKQRIFVKGNIYEGWDAIPERYKGPAGINDLAIKRGTTMFTLQF